MVVSNFTVSSGYFGREQIPVTISATVFRSDGVTSGKPGIICRLRFVFGTPQVTTTTFTGGIYIYGANSSNPFRMTPTNGGSATSLASGTLTLKQNGTTYSPFTWDMPSYVRRDGYDVMGDVGFNISGTLFTYEQYNFSTTFSTASAFYPDRLRVTLPALSDYRLNSGTSNTISGITYPSVTGLTMTLKYKIGSIAETTIASSTTATSVSWTPSVTAVGAQFPESMEGTFTYICITEISGGATYSYSEEYTQRVYLTDYSISLTASSDDLTYYRQWGTSNLQNISYATIDIRGNATHPYGGYWKQYSLIINSQTITHDVEESERSSWVTLTSDVFANAVTSEAIKIVVKDSRDISREVTLSSDTLTVAAYAPPTFSAESAYRYDISTSSASDIGTSIKLSATVVNNHEFTDVTNTITYATKKLSEEESAYNTDHPNLTSGVEIVSTSAASVTDVFATEFSWIIKFTVTDSIIALYPDLLSPTTITVIVSTGRVIVHMKSDGLGIAFGGRADESNTLKSYWLMKATNGLEVNGHGVSANLASVSNSGSVQVNDSSTTQVLSVDISDPGTYILIASTKIYQPSITYQSFVLFQTFITGSGLYSLLGNPCTTSYNFSSGSMSDYITPTGLCIYIAKKSSSASTTATINVSIHNNDYYNRYFYTELYCIKLNDETS